MKINKFCLKIFCFMLLIILLILGCEKNNSIMEPKANIAVVPKDDITVTPPDIVEGGNNEEQTVKEVVYYIYSSDELYWIANEVNKKRNNFRGKTVKLMNDIDMENKPFEGIATGGKDNKPYYSFEGTFDGNGKRIKGLNIEDTSGYYIGFIGNLGKGTVKNLEIESGSIKGQNFVGGIAGVSWGVIENCNNKAAVEGLEYVGGIAGYNYYYSTITNSGNSANITGSKEKSEYGFVGGIAGANGGIVASSYNTGSVTGRNQVGGIIGANISTVKNSYNTGTVDGNDMVGGVLGNNMGTIKYSYNTGDVKATHSSGSAGGVVALSWGGSYGGSPVIENCYNIGKVSSPYVTYLGGVVGYRAAGEVKNSFFLQDKAIHGVGYPDIDNNNAKSISSSDFGGNSTISWSSSSPWQIKSGLGGSVSSRPVLSGVGEEGK